MAAAQATPPRRSVSRPFSAETKGAGPHNTDCPPPPMAPITSDCGTPRCLGSEMALITSGCVPVSTAVHAHGGAAGQPDPSGPVEAEAADREGDEPTVQPHRR